MIRERRDNMKDEKLEIMKNKKGFIAALDQSGGSSKKTLELYGIFPWKYQTDLEMFDLIHEMRTRIIKNESFTSNKILGVILFEETMRRKIEDQYTASYLWNQKGMLSFLKIDKGLEEVRNGVQLMKKIPNLEKTLQEALKKGIFGTKMRSFILEDNKEGIRRVVEQQFLFAKTIYHVGLIPIIEPEISIHAKNKEVCEKILKEEIKKQLDELPEEGNVILKLTLPTSLNFYEDLIKHPNVIRVVALSGGYSKKEACQKLSKNHDMIASFSRALLEGLKVEDTEITFQKKLEQSIEQIYQSSIT